MSIKKWKTVSKKVVFTHPRLSIEEHVAELPNGKTTDYIQFSDTGQDSVGVIAVNPRGEILIQQEYSYPPDVVMWQLPGGGMETGETVTEAADRELSEESGYIAKNCREIGYFYTSNRLRNQKQFIVVCTDLTEQSLPHDHDEFIESHWLSEARINEMVKAGEVTNINMLAALTIWRHSR